LEVRCDLVQLQGYLDALYRSSPGHCRGVDAVSCQFANPHQLISSILRFPQDEALSFLFFLPMNVLARPVRPELATDGDTQLGPGMGTRTGRHGLRQFVGSRGILQDQGVDEALGADLELCLLALL